MRTFRVKPFIGFLLIMTYAVISLSAGVIIIPAKPHGSSLEGEEVIWGFIFYCFIASICLVFTFTSTKPTDIQMALSKDARGLLKASGGRYTWFHFKLAFLLFLIGSSIMIGGLFYSSALSMESE